MNKPRILALDTVSEACSVALLIDDAMHTRFEIAPNAHSKLILEMVDAVLRDAQLQLDQLDAIAVDVGPGSFTGVRIGIGVAQGLAYGAGVNAIAVNSMETLAVGATLDSDNTDDAFALPAIDARMGQVYYALYRIAKADESFSIPKAIIEPSLIEPNRLSIADATIASANIIGVGSGWDVYEAVLRAALNANVECKLTCYPQAASVARLAAARGIENAISPLALSASYIRDEVVKMPKSPR